MKKRILIVDDNPWNAQLVAEVLERHNYTVEVVMRGDTALELIEANQPDMVLLDLMLPDINGIDIARELRETHNNSDLPIIALTALGNLTIQRRCMEAGFNEVIVKPVTNREVVDVVKRYV
ncbi:MAG: response regulator [Anaerolineae bacterium]|nr:response regulator [Anaerolineae bacterium]MCA9895365.1 response regulator [Anaerolineae bacterium]MCB9461768.1 response regulator [Anaerolineaceae bacterium]